MTTLIKSLPYDINWYIANFNDSIDIRRSFGIYNKIQKEKFKFLNKIIRNTRELKNYSNTIFKSKFYLENLYNRSEDDVENDMIETLIEIKDDKVYSEMHIFRLIPKPNSEFKSHKDIYYKGNLSNTHYWKYIVICSDNF